MSNEWQNAPALRQSNPGHYETAPSPQHYGGSQY